MGTTENILKRTVPVPRNKKDVGNLLATGGLSQVADSFKVPGVIGEEMTPTAVAPPIADPIAMPDPLQQQKAKERSLIEQLSRRGRQGTVLTGGRDRLGS